MLADVALGRPEHVFDLSGPLRELRSRGERVLVTGAAGMVGSALVDVLRDADIDVLATDLAPRPRPEMCVKLDITRFGEVLETVGFYRPSLIVNCAAEKCAVEGEKNPWRTINTSINGVQNLLNMGVRVVLCSTCKAADPEVAYGIGKAAAEKLVLDAGGTVVRFFNVFDAGGNVLEAWQRLPEGEPLPVTPCRRFFISLNEAVGALVSGLVLPSGRYAPDPGGRVWMTAYARRVFPGRRLVLVEPRRGDRLTEPLHGVCEQSVPAGVPFLNRIASVHDARQGEDDGCR